LYFCGYDISLPDGPGTNEFEFTRCMAKRLGKGAWCVLPNPSSTVPHLEDVNVLFYSLPRIRNLFRYVGCCLEVAKSIDQMCTENDIDIICLRLPAIPVIPWLLQVRHKRRLFLKTLGEWWYNEPPSSWIDGLLRGLGNMMRKQIIRRALGMDVAIEGVHRQAINLLGSDESIVLVPNAANIDHFTPAAGVLPGLEVDGAWPVLGFIGTSPSSRGVREMIELLPRLLIDFPKAAVLAAGWDNGMEELKIRAKQLGVADRCHLLGWISYPEVPKLVNAMDICFSFFEPIRIEREGNCSQKVRQYLACGKPVLSIRSGHAFLEEHDLGSIVDPADLNGVETALRLWLERIKANPEKVANKLREYAVAHLSTDRTFLDRLAFWENCISTTRENP
ncbi:MAG: glycosyltransferase, partial [Proteobacteria bacterium]|nr:glycosyltransferase [Pseudomonadota bacterium]MBU1610737.1 glycosyltransferase [Pseudomonadota bacterium]